MGQGSSIAYPVVTDAEFPHGLRCMECDRVIDAGQPYTSNVDSILSDEEATVIEGLCCVYCA